MNIENMLATAGHATAEGAAFATRHLHSRPSRNTIDRFSRDELSQADEAELSGLTGAADEEKEHYRSASLARFAQNFTRRIACLLLVLAALAACLVLAYSRARPEPSAQTLLHHDDALLPAAVPLPQPAPPLVQSQAHAARGSPSLRTPPHVPRGSPSAPSASPSPAMPPSPRSPRSPRACTRIGPAMPVRTLFVGNSFIRHNGLIHMYRALVESSPTSSVVIEAVAALAADASTLSMHVASGLPKRGGPWTHVVLQEQSEIPGLSPTSTDFRSSLRASAELSRTAVAQGAQQIALLQTWGFRDGDARLFGSADNYTSNQARITRGYELMLHNVASVLGANASTRLGNSSAHGVRAAAARTRVLVAPVGAAFDAVRRSSGVAGSGLGSLRQQHLAAGLFAALYAEDGRHPSLRGTYLAACTIASTLHGLRPSLLNHVPNGIGAQTAAALRMAAEQVAVEHVHELEASRLECVR